MKKLLCTVALVGMLAAPLAVQAQGMQAGPLLAYADDYEAFGIGGFIAIPMPSLHPQISIVPDLTWYFPDGFDLVEINGDLLYTFTVSAEAPVVPWAFGGLNIARASGGGDSNTEVGINLGGGVDFRAGSVTPFAGAKVELEGGDTFVIFGGLAFAIGGGA